MQSLKDKLLKAGLVTPEAAKEAEAAPAPARTEARPPPSSSPRKRHDAPIPKLPPLPGSKEAHRLMSRRQLELDRTIRELVLEHQVATEPGATTFHFVTRKNRLRRLELTEAQARQLEQGELAVVERPDPDKIEHALVPAAIARQLIGLSPRAVRFLNQADARVGFLSDEEIHARAAEATPDVAEVNDVDDDDEAASAEPPEDPQGPPEPATFITVRRSPRS